MEPKQNWQERVIELEQYIEEGGLSIREAANELNRSVGSIHGDLRLAAGLRVYPDIEKMKYAEALRYLKKKGFQK